MKEKFTILLLIMTVIVSNLPFKVDAEGKSDIRNETMYLIMTDRFNNGDPSNDFDVNPSDPTSFHGGDFKGISQKLDYIKEMGFTSILLTPIFENSEQGYDGYSITNYNEVEEHFGTLEDFKTLVNDAHERDIKVIIEFVFQPEIGKGELLDLARGWVTETGIDGYRLTNSPQQSAEFLNEFVATMKSEDENFLVIAEIEDAIGLGKLELETAGVDVIIDNRLFTLTNDILSRSNGDLESLYTILGQYNDGSYSVGQFFDNHHQVRFTRKALDNQEHPVTRLKLALSYIFLSPGVPIVYYGTEIALDGGEVPDNRKLMNFRTDDELVNYITKLGKVKSAFPALTTGEFELLHSSEDGMTVFKRTNEDETLIVAINNSAKTQKVNISTGQLPSNKQLTGVLNDDIVLNDKEGYTIVLDRETVEVYHLENASGINIAFILVIILVPLLLIGFFYINKRRVSK